MKVCRTCKTDKDISQFASAGQGDRLRGTCKECSRAKEKSQLEARRAADGAIPETRCCSRCGETKPLGNAHFKTSKSCSFGFKTECKSCSKKRNAEWRKTDVGVIIRNRAAEKRRPQARIYAKAYQKLHMDKFAENSKAWRLRNLDKSMASSREYGRKNKSLRTEQRHSRRAAGAFSYSVITELRALQKNKCTICRCTFSKFVEIDHIMPIALGGTNERGNLQLLCRYCNRSKGAKHPVDYMQSRGFLL